MVFLNEGSSLAEGANTHFQHGMDLGQLIQTTKIRATLKLTEN